MQQIGFQKYVTHICLYHKKLKKLFHTGQNSFHIHHNDHTLEKQQLIAWDLCKERMTMMKIIEISEGQVIIKLRNPIRINDSIRNYKPFPSEQSLVLRITVPTAIHLLKITFPK